MFSTILSQVAKNNIALIKPYKTKNYLLNPVFFGTHIPENLGKHKELFLEKLDKKRGKLEKLLKKSETDYDSLVPKGKEIIRSEIEHILSKLDFLAAVYDFEANKIDPNYVIQNPDIDFDFYNKKFFGVTRDYISKIREYKKNTSFEIVFGKKDLQELLLFTKECVPDFKYKLLDVMYMSHSSGTLFIPKKELYTIREIVTLFFHEMTHFFRGNNQLRNLGFAYDFSDYSKYEEGIALYNEYHYGKLLLGNYHYNSYYDLCYGIILSDISEEEKKEKIHHILCKKGYTREKSLYYYYRFYRYTSIGSKQLFLKDLIYTKGYRRIKRLIEKDEKNYEKIMAGNIGPKGFKYAYIPSNNNFDTKKYFGQMLEKIASMI